MALSQAKLMAFRNSRTQGAIGLVYYPTEIAQIERQNEEPQ